MLLNIYSVQLWLSHHASALRKFYSSYPEITSHPVTLSAEFFRIEKLLSNRVQWFSVESQNKIKKQPHHPVKMLSVRARHILIWFNF